MGNLIQENEKRLLEIVKRYENEEGREILFEIGTIGILKAFAQKEDLNSEEFQVYVELCIEKEIQSYLNQKEEFFEEVEAASEERVLTGELSEKIFDLRFVIHKTQKEVAKILELPIVKVREVEKEIVKKFKRKITEK